MRKIVIPSLVVTAMVAGLWTVTTSKAQAKGLYDTQDSHSNRHQELAAVATEETAVSTSDRLIAQLFYPAVGDGQAFRVIGRGRATGPADTARIEFKFSNTNPLESPPEGTLSQFDGEATPLKKESFKPIVDALVESGVPADAIEVKVVEPRINSFPFPFPSVEAGGAQVIVTLEQPTRSRIEEVVTVVSEAASKSKELIVSSTGVQYAVSDCQALERAAYQAAIKDAQNRARAIAEATGAEVAKVPSVAEPFYDIFLPGCSTGGNFPFGNVTTPYEPTAPAEVEVTKDIFVSFPVR